MALTSLVPILVLLACATSIQAQQRQLLLRLNPGWNGMKKKCSNSVHGRLLLADSQGYVCTRDQMDYSTGCCKQGLQYSCDMCKLADKCCAEYEHCVSCCLDPRHNAEKLYSTTLRVAKLPAAGAWSSPWEYCLGICRTHGHSTMHENAYISSRHHCFSALGRPMVSDPLPPGTLDNVKVVLSAAGESCDTACSQLGATCSAQHLRVLNSCDRLREHAMCEAGCEAVKLPGGSMPAYVEAGAPKANSPTMCFTTPAEEVAMLGCAAKDQHARRLCPCTGDQATVLRLQDADACLSPPVKAGGTTRMAHAGVAALQPPKAAKARKVVTTVQDDSDSRGSIPPCWPGMTAPKSSTAMSATVQEKLLVPKRLCQTHLGALAEDGTTVHVCMLCIKVALQGDAVTSCQRVQLPFKPNQGYVTVMGVDTEPILGKRVIGWSFEDCSTHIADVQHCMSIVEGYPVFWGPTGEQQPLSTDKILVLEVDMRTIVAIPYIPKPVPPAGSMPTALVPGVPMFAGSRVYDGTSCAHCGTTRSTIWRKGWMAPAMVGNPAALGVADVNLCNGCGLRWGKNPCVFQKTIDRTTGQRVAHTSGEDEADENTRPLSIDGSDMLAFRKQATSHKPHSRHKLELQELAQAACNTAYEDSDGGDVSAGVLNAARMIATDALMSRQHTSQHGTARHCHAYLGADHQGPTECMQCGVNSCTEGWAKGWVLGLQGQPGLEPLYANLCNMCGVQYQKNPVGLLQPSQSVLPASSEQHSHGQSASTHSEAASQRAHLTRKRTAASQHCELPVDAVKAYTVAGPARKVPRTSAGKSSPPLLPYISGSCTVLDLSALAACTQEAHHGDGSEHMTFAQQHQPDTAQPASLPNTIRHHTTRPAQDIHQQPAMDIDQKLATDIDQQAIDEAEVAELLASGMRRQHEAVKPLAEQMTSHANRAAAPSNDSAQVVPATSQPSLGGVGPALELPILSYQPLIVPDGLVLRHFPSAADYSKPCYVRMVYMCAKQHLVSGKEWVQLVRHAATRQVRVEGASLTPLYGKVMVGWRVVDARRAPPPCPLKHADSWVWQDPNTSQRLPLSSSKALVLEVRETSAPLELPLPLPIRPQQTNPASAVHWAPGAAGWVGMGSGNSSTGGPQTVGSGDGSKDSSQARFVLPGAHAVQHATGLSDKERQVLLQQHVQALSRATGGLQNGVDGTLPHSAAPSPRPSSSAGSGAGAHMDVDMRDQDARATQDVQSVPASRQRSKAVEQATAAVPGPAVSEDEITKQAVLASRRNNAALVDAQSVDGQQHQDRVHACATEQASPPRASLAASAARAARDALVRLLGGEDEQQAPKQHAAAAEQGDATAAQGAQAAGVAAMQQDLEAEGSQPDGRGPCHTAAAAAADISSLRSQVQAINAGLPSNAPVLSSVSVPPLSSSARQALLQAIQAQGAVAHVAGSQPPARLQHSEPASKHHPAQPTADQTLNKHASNTPPQQPAAMVADEPAASDQSNGFGRSAAAQALAMLKSAAAVDTLSVASHSKPAYRQEPAAAQAASVVSHSKAASEQHAAGDGDVQPLANQAAAPAQAPGNAGPEGHGGSQGASIADAHGEMLDSLRPIVMCLRHHGGPAVSSVWAAVRSMSADELRSAKRHGLPWVQSLYDEQQYTECAEMLREVLNMKPA